MKIVSGSTAEVTQKMKMLYEHIIDAGIHVAPSMKVAEASKLIENIQRDVNIALMNEVSVLFNALGVDTHDVIEAASTKWNFHPYLPGLVGGHCIGVDPYYLIYNGEKKGVKTPLIAQARETNNTMADYIVQKSLLLMQERGIDAHKASVLLLGITFKENCPDIRNSQSVKIIELLNKEVAEVNVYDPVADKKDFLQMYDLHLLEVLKQKSYDAVIISVGHDIFKTMPMREYLKKDGLLLDLKGILPKGQSDFRL
jgi:UDP-N-acetyl-D-galactosamine dehydrogenase